MNPLELLSYVMRGQTLEARQWVLTARRGRFAWGEVQRPEGLDATALAVYAGLIEMMASRSGQAPPPWTSQVEAAPSPTYLLPLAKANRRLAEQCKRESPAPLRSRGVYALAGFLA